MGIWRDDFGRLVDISLVSWGGVSGVHAVVSGGGYRQRRHFAEKIAARLHYPGYPFDGGSTQRMSGRTPGKVTRTDEHRKDDNRRWIEKYNNLDGVEGGSEFRAGRRRFLLVMVCACARERERRPTVAQNRKRISKRPWWRLVTEFVPTTECQGAERNTSRLGNIATMCIGDLIRGNAEIIISNWPFSMT